MSLSGHCLCGAVTYSTESDPIMVAICHCEHCQRQSGAPFSLNVAVDRGELTIGGESMTTYETVGGAMDMKRERIFCSTCGSPLVSILEEANDMAFIKAGTLDDTSAITPELEVYTDSAQPWFHAEEADERGLFPAGIPT